MDPRPPSNKALLLGASDDPTTRVIFSIWSVHLITILQAGGAALATAVALGALVGSAQVGGRAVE